MIELSSLDSYRVRGREVFIVASPREMDREKPEIIGEIVKLDGRLVLVEGVERRLPNSPIRSGEFIGLLVTALGGGGLSPKSLASSPM